MLTGQITCAQKVSIYGKKQQQKTTTTTTKKQKTKKQKNHITGQLPASLQF